MLQCKPILIGMLLLGVVGCRQSKAGFKADDDRAHLFGAKAVEDADLEVRDIKSRYRKDLKIETFPRVSRLRDVLGNLDKKDEAYQEQFFADWARDRARNVDGIYVLICQEHVGIEVTRLTRKYFSSDEAEHLHDLLLTGIREGRADDALGKGVRYVAERLEANLGKVPSPQPFDWLLLTMIAVGLAGAWIILEGMLSARTGLFRSGYAGVSAIGHGLDGNLFVALRSALSAPIPQPTLPATELHVAEAPVSGDGAAAAPEVNEPDRPQDAFRGNTQDAL